MIFSIDIEVFQTDDANHHHLIDRLLELVRIGRHEAIFPILVEEIEASSWFEGLGQRKGSFFVELYEKSISSGFYQQSSNISIVSAGKDNTDNKFTIEDSVFYLEQPAIILLENIHYDRHFINALLKTFEAQEIIEAKKQGWLKYQGAGGTGMVRNTINTLIEETSRPNPKKFLKLFILIDSDKKQADDALKSTQTNIVDFCTQHNIPYHVLYKREMENYLPDSIFNQLPEELKDTAKAFCSLSNEQRDFYDLEKGFHDKGPGHRNMPIIFQDIDENTHHLLRKGFNRSGNSSEISFIAKQELPLLFNNEAITKKELEDRVAHQEGTDSNGNPQNKELSTIIEKINSIL